MHPEAAEIVHVMLLTGAVKIKAFNLERKKIDGGQATATVIQKGGREHVFALSAEAIFLLRSLSNRGRYLFDTTNWLKRFDKAKRDVGLNSLRWHDLRHSSNLACAVRRATRSNQDSAGSLINQRHSDVSTRKSARSAGSDIKRSSTFPSTGKYRALKTVSN